MFKLEVNRKPEKAQIYNIQAKEISIFSSLILGVLFLLIFCILLTCSLYRQRNLDKMEFAEPQELEHIYGKLKVFLN